MVTCANCGPNPCTHTANNGVATEVRRSVRIPSLTFFSVSVLTVHCMLLTFRLSVFVYNTLPNSFQWEGSFFKEETSRIYCCNYYYKQLLARAFMGSRARRGFGTCTFLVRPTTPAATPSRQLRPDIAGKPLPGYSPLYCNLMWSASFK